MAQAGAVVAGVFAALALILIAFAARAVVLHQRSGSFPMFVLERGRWVRGICIYGERNLAWWRSYSLRMRPDRLVSRRVVDLLAAGQAADGETLTVLELGVDGVALTLAMTAGDASGVVAWIDSAPPGE